MQHPDYAPDTEFDTRTDEDPAPHDAESARNRIIDRIIQNLNAIVGGFIEAAKTGSATHMKLVFDLLKTPAAEAPQQPQQNSASQLLEELRRRSSPQSADSHQAPPASASPEGI